MTAKEYFIHLGYEDITDPISEAEREIHFFHKEMEVYIIFYNETETFEVKGNIGAFADVLDAIKCQVEELGWDV